VANADQVSMLCSSVTRFNKWRADNPQAVVNLWGANLRDADLTGANLKGANLSGADLRGVYLEGADLREANLRETNLSGANLWGADLREANLWRANLNVANLERANLDGANLEGTLLEKDRWFPILTALWDNVCEKRRRALVRALSKGEALHGVWVQGSLMCPEGYLLGGRGKTDAFTRAWDTFGIDESVLPLLKNHDSAFFAEGQSPA